MRRIAAVIGMSVCGVVAAPAEQLGPGGMQFKNHPSVPGGGVQYSATLPPYLSSPNMLDELVSPITGEFVGTVTSSVFRNPETGFLGFAYVVELSDMSPQPPIVRATMDGWAGVEILDAGADASGNSGTFDPNPEWLDGDPYSISRDPFTEGLAIQWRQSLASGLIGTVIGPGDTSSVLFFATNVTDFTVGEIDLIDTAFTGEAPVLVPIPEPSSVVLLALGVALRFVARLR